MGPNSELIGPRGAHKFSVSFNRLCLASAPLINCYDLFSILILASAVFFFGPGKTENGSPAGLFDAFDLIQGLVGRGKFCIPFTLNRRADNESTAAAVVFAVALICSGQSASITATLAGQIVSEGFIQWSISVSSPSTTITLRY